MILAELIYQARKRAGLSQEELADRLGVTRQAVSKWETGKSVPDTENIRRMTAVLAVSADYFLGSDSTATDDSPEPKADSAVTGIGDVAESLNRADIEGLVISFKDFLGSLQDPDGTIGKFLYDGKVYDSLESLISDADSLLKKIEENPKKYIRISIF